MASIIKGFLPWILFFLLFGNSPIAKETATIVALISHIVINRHTIRMGFVFDIGTALFFLLFALNIFIFKYPVITHNGNLMANLILAIIAWTSLIIKQPFTLQYARLTVSKEIALTRPFLLINYILTSIWAILLTLIALPNILEHYIHIQYANEINTGISILFLLIGIFITKKLPHWLINKMVSKKFNINIKQLFQKNNTKAIDFTNFNSENINHTCDVSTDVIIVGAGPIGLTSALLLTSFGIKVVVLERHSGISTHPKARAISCRSMELFRKLGVDNAITKYSLPDARNWFGWFKNLTGKVYARVVKTTDYSKISPTDETNVAQHFLEKVLLEKLQYQGIPVMFQQQLTEFAQNDTMIQVVSEQHDSKAKTVLHAKYMIAADGAHSTVRQLLQIPMIGPDNINLIFSVYCEIDLDHVLDKDKLFSIAFILTKAGPAPMVLSIDGKHKWIFIFPATEDSIATVKRIYTDEYIKRQINTIIGSKQNLPINIISQQVWSLGSQIANQIIAGRTFLAGDSAHRFSPTGGMGMNTGLQDVDNLMWKLAFVLQGNATANLLESYSQERISSILNNMEWSIANLQRIVRFRIILEEKGLDNIDFASYAQEHNAHLNKSGLDLGVIYTSNIIAATEDIKPLMKSDQYIANTYPGSRLPHFELIRDGKTISSLDLIATKFLLLYFANSSNFVDIINFRSIPTDKICLNGNNNIHELHKGQLQQLLQLDEFTAIWVRPDGHIAWKGCVNKKESMLELEKIINLMSV